MGPVTPAAATADGVSPDGLSPGAVAEPPGGFTRLQAFDGLFLRAEHLNGMQDYPQALARALGRTIGSGVSDGLEVSVAGATLRVRAGSALDGAGRLLWVAQGVSLPLAGLEVAADRYWRIEVVARDRLSGHTQAAGQLCAEPCSGSGITQPAWLTQAADVRLVPVTLDGLDGRDPVWRRSWLAGRSFDQEEAGAGRWPYGERLPDWSSALDPAGKEAVALGVLLHLPGLGPDGGDWVCDQWTLRRDLGDPPAARQWQWRLGMRPWDVFVAQVLQFQTQLAGHLSWLTAGRQPGPIEVVSHDLQTLIDMVKRTTKDRLTEEIALIQKRLVAPGQAAPHQAVVAPSLAALGISTLPPAGFLPDVLLTLDHRGIRVSDDVVLPVRACYGEPFDVAQALAEAQSRPRIPLPTSPDGPFVAVDLLTPSESTTDDHSWVLFVRRDERWCDDREQVEVLLYREDRADAAELAKGVLPPDDAAHAPEVDHVLWYRPLEWLVPEFQEWLSDQLIVAEPEVYVFVATRRRGPLVTLRAATLLGIDPFDAGGRITVVTVPGPERIVMLAQVPVP